MVILIFLSVFSRVSAADDEKITFSKEIAPLIFKHCSLCHRPGQAAPFSLLSYEDVMKKKETIRDAVNSRLMPPWLPAAQKHRFAGERKLSDSEVRLINEWIDHGAPEGDRKDLPTVPQWSDGWSLGKPDLVLSMPEPYVLKPDGTDVYRAFVVPTSIVATQYIAAVEFDPGNYQVVHHAFIRLDPSKGSRRRDAEDAEVGFAGLHAPGTVMPEGFFSSWQPGKMPSRYPEGLSWPLVPGTDIVIQMHLRPSGKPEKIQARVAFYYAKSPPSKAPLKLYLRNTSIDVPANATNSVVEDSLVLPVDLSILGILPHAHFLAREIEAFAELPGGTREELLRIPNWDFSWQGDYAYETPVKLPRGSILRMRVHYDNSTNNVRNPSSPPRRVQYGLQSKDEMAEVWFQVIVNSSADHALLSKQLTRRMLGDTIEYNQFLLRSNPNDPIALIQLGKAALARGEYQKAEGLLIQAIKIQPEAEAFYHLGLLQEMKGQKAAAQRDYEAALRINPDYHMAHNNLGLLWLDAGKYTNAIYHLQEAVRIAPLDTIPRENLEYARQLMLKDKSR